LESILEKLLFSYMKITKLNPILALVKVYLIDSSVVKVFRQALSAESLSRLNPWFVTGLTDAEGCFLWGFKKVKLV
jgi:hypothetical protein